ncbi:Phage late control protein GPD [compost metagenome]
MAKRGIFRPKVIVDSSSESQDMATTRARKLLADSRLEGLEIRAVVKGHRSASGKVWAPGQRVQVRSEPHGLDDTYFLMSRTLRLTRGQGAITELRLREDKMWVLDGNPVKKHKGKSNKDAAFIELIKGL